ncbi:hypothetical protein KNU12_gp205 [Klebsiella phage KP179]|uniref:Uncharacterized protein n=1 Tax=Klebsiella phage KP179 TaxID=2315700 RepID=A0A386K7C9_9CAUD|nr:hypothetical protein KNU12_gp205 [Klebsiella phage KP179]AYD80847.1 hypothetical protein [Klebsiella phage KP179]UNY41114.1 hypothetical protein [Klebsiella phage KP185]
MEYPLIVILGLGLGAIGILYGMDLYERHLNYKWARKCVERNVNPR